MVYTDEAKCEILRLFYKNNNVSAARAEYRRIHGEPVPSRSTFRNIERRFVERKSISRKKRTVAINEGEELDILLYFEGNNFFK